VLASQEGLGYMVLVNYLKLLKTRSATNRYSERSNR